MRPSLDAERCHPFLGGRVKIGLARTITGQNPTSSEPAAKALLLRLHNRVAVD